MKAVVYQGFGGPEVLELATAEPPETGPTEVLVAVELAAVNFADVNARRAGFNHRLNQLENVKRTSEAGLGVRDDWREPVDISFPFSMSDLVGPKK